MKSQRTIRSPRRAQSKHSLSHNTSSSSRNIHHSPHLTLKPAQRPNADPDPTEQINQPHAVQDFDNTIQSQSTSPTSHRLRSKKSALKSSLPSYLPSRPTSLPLPPDQHPKITLNSTITNGQFRGNKLLDVDTQFFVMNADRGLLALHPGLQEAASARAQTPFYSTFSSTHLDSYHIDPHWAKKYQLCADPAVFPPHWGIGQNLRFGGTRYSGQRINHYTAVLEKAYFFHQLIRACNNRRVLLKAYSDISTMDSFLDLPTFGAYSLVRYPLFQSPDKLESGGYFEYDFDQFDDDGNFVDPEWKAKLGDSLDNWSSPPPHADPAILKEGKRASLAPRSAQPLLGREVNIRRMHEEHLERRRIRGEIGKDVVHGDDSGASEESGKKVLNKPAKKTTKTTATSLPNDNDSDDDDDEKEYEDRHETETERLDNRLNLFDFAVPDSALPKTRTGKNKKLSQSEYLEIETDFSQFCQQLENTASVEAKKRLHGSSDVNIDHKNKDSTMNKRGIHGSGDSRGIGDVSLEDLFNSPGKHETVDLFAGTNFEKSGKGKRTEKVKGKKPDQTVVQQQPSPPLDQPMTGREKRALSKMKRLKLHQEMEIDFDESVLPESIRNLELRDLRVAVETQLNHTISMYLLDIFEANDTGFSDAFYRSNPSAYVRALHEQATLSSRQAREEVSQIAAPTYLRPLLLSESTPLIQTSLNKHVRDYLEPYLEVPDHLPPNFVFSGTGHVQNLQHPGLTYLTTIAAVDGTGNEFAANLAPIYDEETKSAILETGNTWLLTRYFAQPKINVEAGIDAFFQWLYHPTSHRTPLHFTPNPNYSSPLLNIPMWQKIRSKTTARDATNLEMAALPSVIRKLFLEHRKGTSTKLPTFDFTSGVLYVGGLKMALDEKVSVPTRTVVTPQGHKRLYVNIPTFHGTFNGITRDEGDNIVKDAEIIEVGSFDHPPFQPPPPPPPLTPSPVSPVILIDPTIGASLTALDSNVRSIDYHMHGSNVLPPYTMESLLKMSPEHRERLLPSIHRDHARDSFRKAIYDTGIATFDPIQALNAFFAVDPFSIYFPSVERVHAVLSNKDQSISAQHPLLCAHLTRDLFFLPGIAGAFYRAELHRVYENTMNKGSYSLHEGMNYPDQLWQEDITFGQADPRYPLLQYDYKTNNYIPQVSKRGEDFYHILGVPVKHHVLMDLPKEYVQTNPINPNVPGKNWYGKDERM